LVRASRCVHPLNEGRLRQDVATRGAVIDSNRVEQQQAMDFSSTTAAPLVCTLAQTLLHPANAPKWRESRRQGDYRWISVGVTRVRVRTEEVVMI
jgi:hypothetical protein